MSNTHDLQQYKFSKTKIIHLSENLKILDSIANIVYNNLDRPFAWPIIDLIFEYQIKYGMELKDHEKVIKERGKINGEK